jgi:surface antigen
MEARMRTFPLLSMLIVAIGATVSPFPSFADPPPWAPAHGWRNHHQRDDDDRAPPVIVEQAPPAVVERPVVISQGGCNRSLLADSFSTSTGNVVGSLAGAAAGGLLGNQFGKGSGKTAATVLGVVAGAMVGGSIGRSMDPADQGCVGQALEHADTNAPVAWQNPGTGAQYQVTPVKTYQTSAGIYCRDYTTRAVIDGRSQEVSGTACRQPDGSWRAQN